MPSRWWGIVALLGSICAFVATRQIGFAQRQLFYHGSAACPSAGFFEGWYYKFVSADRQHTLALIPGVYCPGPTASGHAALEDVQAGPHSFLMAVLDGNTHYFRFPSTMLHDGEGDQSSRFLQGDGASLAQAWRHELRVHLNRSSDGREGGLDQAAGFTDRSVHLDLQAEPDVYGDEAGVSMQGTLDFPQSASWPITLSEPGAMGWFMYAPFLQCYHAVASLLHSVTQGSVTVTVPGQSGSTQIDFSGGTGYLEKDWGSSFPDAWLWGQGFLASQPALTASHDGDTAASSDAAGGGAHGAVDASLFYSMARIPWYFGVTFPGFLIGLDLRAASPLQLPTDTDPDPQEDAAAARPGDLAALHVFASHSGARFESLAVDAQNTLSFVVSDARYRLSVVSAQTPEAAAPTGWTHAWPQVPPSAAGTSGVSLLYGPRADAGGMVPYVEESVSGGVTAVCLQHASATADDPCLWSAHASLSTSSEVMVEPEDLEWMVQQLVTAPRPLPTLYNCFGLLPLPYIPTVGASYLVLVLVAVVILRRMRCCCFRRSRSVAGLVQRNERNLVKHCGLSSGALKSHGVTFSDANLRRYTGTESVGAEYDAWTTEGILRYYWGDHIHHGYYPDGTSSGVDHKRAKIDMTNRLLDFALGGSQYHTHWRHVSQGMNFSMGTTLPSPDTVHQHTGQSTEVKDRHGPTELKHRRVQRVLDVGCGIAGSSRHMAHVFGAGTRVDGVTLSPQQVEMGDQLAREQGVEQQVTLQVADALNLPFKDNTFDLVWSCESGEHMPDKQRFVEEMHRVLRPGGVLIVATWCHREANLEEKDAKRPYACKYTLGKETVSDKLPKYPVRTGPLRGSECRLLAKVYNEWALPYFVSISDYTERILACVDQRSGRVSDPEDSKFTPSFVNIRSVDWTAQAHPTWWHAVWVGIVDPLFWLCKGLRVVWRTVRDVVAIYYMCDGYQRGIIKYGVFTAQKKQKKS